MENKYMWSNDLFESLKRRLEPDFSVSLVHVLGEPEVHVTWPGGPPAKLILALGEERDGKRYAFATFGVEECGGIQKNIDGMETSENDFFFNVEDEIVRDARQFRAMVEVIKRNTKNRK